MPNENNSELIQFISEKFDKVGEKFEKFENHMSEKFDGVDKKLEKVKEELKKDIRDNGEKIDKATGLYLKQEKESVSMGNAVRRNEKNIEILAVATGTEIEKD